MVEGTPTEIKYLIKQSKNREQFDPMCRGIKVVESVDENTVVAHLVDTKYFFNRDFCLLRHSYTTVRALFPFVLSTSRFLLTLLLFFLV